MGEFARSSAIARAVAVRWPQAQLHFVLSRQAPYAATAPFPKTLLASSATFHSAAVIKLMRSWRPHVVIFDNAGRTAQLKAARRLGAKLVYISARRRQRAKAFRLRWMNLLDEHWIAYPEFIAGKLSLLERLKLRWIHRPAVRFLDVIVSRSSRAPIDVLAQAGCTAGTYTLVVPGGGTGHPGAASAVAEFLTAARALAAAGTATVFVAPSVPDATPEENLHLPGLLPQQDLAELMRHARLVVANGGSTLLQSIACGAACLAVPIARDQHERIERCVEVGVAVESRLDARSIFSSATRLLKDDPLRAALVRRAGALVLADGCEVAVRALAALLDA